MVGPVAFEQENVLEVEAVALERQTPTEGLVAFEQNRMPELEAAAVAQSNKGHRHRFHFWHHVLFKSHQPRHQHLNSKCQCNPAGCNISVLASLVLFFAYKHTIYLLVTTFL